MDYQAIHLLTKKEKEALKAYKLFLQYKKLRGNKNTFDTTIKNACKKLCLNGRGELEEAVTLLA